MRKLSDLEVGETGVLVALELPPGVQNHLMYMGFVPDALVRVLHRAPIGDPTVYSLDGIEIALRRETAKSIMVRLLVRDGHASPIATDLVAHHDAKKPVQTVGAAVGETTEKEQLVEAAR